MNFKYELLENYDKHYKLNKSEISCFSKKELDNLYPEENYSIVGEIRGKLYDPDKVYDEEPTTVKIKNKEYIVECPRKNNKFIYNRYRYISVGDNKYVVILKNRLPFIILLLLLLLGICVSVALIFHMLLDKDEEIIQIQPEEDIHIEQMEDDDTEKISSPEGGGSVSMEYSLFANINLTTNEIEVYFKNPNESNHNVTLDLYVMSGEDKVILAKSGTIPPRSKLTKLELLPEAKTLLKEGKYKGLFKVGYYEPNSGEKAILESEMENVEITVSK